MLLDLLLVVDLRGLARLRFLGFRFPCSSTSLRQREVHLATRKHIRAVAVVELVEVFSVARLGFFDLQLAAAEAVSVELGHGSVGRVDVGVLDEGEVVFDHDFDDVSELVEEVVQVALLDRGAQVAHVDARDRQAACSATRTFFEPRPRLLDDDACRANALAVELFDGLLGSLGLDILDKGEVFFHEDVDDFAVLREHVQQLLALDRAVQPADVDAGVIVEVYLVCDC